MNVSVCIYSSLFFIFLYNLSNVNNVYCNQTDSSFQQGLSTSSPEYSRLPKLLVFSLDFVIWPFKVDEDVVTPVKKDKKTGRVRDFVLKDLGIYGDALDALNTLYLKRCRMAAVSDSPDVETNTKLLMYFNLYHYFPIQEIFGGPKVQHIEVIHTTTQVPYEEMFFFDVQNEQLSEIKKFGVNVVEVQEGLSLDDFNEALKLYNAGSSIT